jgi:hypothetical protein
VPEPSVPLTLPAGRALAGAPGAGERTVVERPPPGLGRGAQTAPGVAVILLAVAIVVVFLSYYALRFRRRRNK